MQKHKTVQEDTMSTEINQNVIIGNFNVKLGKINFKTLKTYFSYIV